MTVCRPSARRMTMKPPPPRLPAAGCVTASAKPTATAASTALPPARRISIPAWLACTSVDPTIACRARTGSREAPWRAVVHSAAATSAPSSARRRRTGIRGRDGPASPRDAPEVYQYNRDSTSLARAFRPAWGRAGSRGAHRRRAAAAGRLRSRKPSQMSDHSPRPAPVMQSDASDPLQLLGTLFELGREVTSVLDFYELLVKYPELLSRLSMFSAFAVRLMDEMYLVLLRHYAVDYLESVT